MDEPFKDDRPGKKMVAKTLARYPELTIWKPESLEAVRAAGCKKEKLTQWYADFENFPRNS